MADYEIGYRKPPESGRFKAGASGNPKGRPKKKSPSLAETINRVLNAQIEYRERGRTKVASARELSLKLLVNRAVSGNLEAAELVPKILEHAARYGDAGVEQIAISDWLPDYPGQSGEQKARDLKANREHDAQSAQQFERPKE
jgi:hypothetical protein